MPSPKDGSPVGLISPVAPREALDADKADPGQMAQIKAEQSAAGAGKYGSTPAKPFKRSDAPDDPDAPTTWIEIALVDRNGKPVPGEPYQLTLPDGTTTGGTLGPDGVAREDGIPPGSCQVTFPQRDGKDWKKI